MVSDVQLEMMQEDAEEYKEKALALIESQPELAARYLLQAASIHLNIAQKADTKKTRQEHLKRGGRLRERAGLLTDEPLETNPVEDKPESRSENGDTPENREPDTSSADSEFFQDPPQLDLSDVGGLHDVKDKLREKIQTPLQHPEVFRKQVGSGENTGIENGVLLYGPPGTGKSHVVKCFAGELGLPYAEVHSDQIESKWVGEAPKNIEQLFSDADELEPCIIFIDEIDALATDRSTGPSGTKSQRQVVNKLLGKMQDVQDSDVAVFAATNKLEDLDGAIKRSQRFNEKLRIGPPKAGARQQILEVQLDDGVREVDWDSIDWKQIMEWTEGYSAADLATVSDRAARKSGHDSVDEDTVIPVNYRHLLEALKETEASLKYWNDGEEV